MTRIINFKQVWGPFLFLIISIMCQISHSESNEGTTLLPDVAEKSSRNLNLDSPLQGNQNLPELQKENKNNWELVEVKVDEIPENAEVYVSEYPEDAKLDQEIMDTARSIVFRPLFRYKNKQEAFRRPSDGFNRRYYIPKMYYKRTYYPYYYNRRFYYN